MELVSPAGSVEKLEYAWRFGADSAYIGLKKFSLRVKAENFHEKEYERVAELKKLFPNRKLFCALNIAFHQNDLEILRSNLDYFKLYPIDSFIVQDLGVVRLLQKEFPSAHLHLSTQASCMNAEAVKMYSDLGFSRVVLGRETSLDEIKKIKDAVPEMELECFAHGAMCVAYSGRCLMSAYLTGRSAQAGFCSHSCRWNFDLKIDEKSAKTLAQSGALVLEENQRRGEFFPVFEGENFTALLSSKDLRMAEHLKEMQAAGIDAIKIEGRMKSVYYVSVVTRAYRKALDVLSGKITQENAEPFVRVLDEVAQRESTTGFYFSRANADKTTVGASGSPYLFAAKVFLPISPDETKSIFEKGEQVLKERQEKLDSMHPSAREAFERDEKLHPEKKVRPAIFHANWKIYPIEAFNKIDEGTSLEFISPDVPFAQIPSDRYEFINPKTGLRLDWVNADHDCALYTDIEIPESALLRIKDPDFDGIAKENAR